MSMRGPGRSLPLLLVVLVVAGCSLGPRRFRDVNDPAPLVRARAANLAGQTPREEFIPELIGHLNDPDAVVRLSSHETLRRRTGQDFGYHPWDDASEREAAVGRWRAWWQSQSQPVTASGQQAMPSGPRIIPTPDGNAAGGPSP